MGDWRSRYSNRPPLNLKEFKVRPGAGPKRKYTKSARRAEFEPSIKEPSIEEGETVKAEGERVVSVKASEGEGFCTACRVGRVEGL